MVEMNEQTEEIIRVARMILDDLQPSDEAEFGRAFSQLDNISIGLVRFAAKIMEGKPFAVDSDNPKTIGRYR